MALEAPAGSGAPPLLRFAAAYGFRNIQSLMRKIKAGKCEYDYVEVGGRGREGRQYEGQVNLQPSSGDHSPVAAVPLCLVRDLTLGPYYSLTGPCVQHCLRTSSSRPQFDPASPPLHCRSWLAPRADPVVPPPSLQIMACPSGCLNGGGQFKPGKGQTPAQLLEQLEQAYGHQVWGGRGTPAGPHPLGHQVCGGEGHASRSTPPRAPVGRGLSLIGTYKALRNTPGPLGPEPSFIIIMAQTAWLPLFSHHSLGTYPASAPSPSSSVPCRIYPASGPPPGPARMCSTGTARGSGGCPARQLLGSFSTQRTESVNAPWGLGL